MAFSLALAGLLLSARILPFRDQIIELRPDGKNLGTIQASYFRLAGVVLVDCPSHFVTN